MHLEKSTCHRIVRSRVMISTLKCSILVMQCLYVMCVTKLLLGYRVSLCHRLVHYLTRSSLTMTALLVIMWITSDTDLVSIQTVMTPLILLIHLKTYHLLHQIQLDQVDQRNLVHTQRIQQYLTDLPESVGHLTDTHPQREEV